MTFHSWNSRRRGKKASFGNATWGEIVDATGVNTSIRDVWKIENEFDNGVSLPDGFFEVLLEHLTLTTLIQEGDRRLVIDKFLLSVIGHKYFAKKLRLSTDVVFSVAGSVIKENNKKLKQCLTGQVDYIIYPSKPGQPHDEVSEKQAHLITVEAKKEWPDASFRQCVAEAAAIHKARKDAGKRNCRVWGYCLMQNTGSLFELKTRANFLFLANFGSN
jgi:hypothetical protein